MVFWQSSKRAVKIDTSNIHQLISYYLKQAPLRQQTTIIHHTNTGAVNFDDQCLLQFNSDIKCELKLLLWLKQHISFFQKMILTSAILSKLQAPSKMQALTHHGTPIQELLYF
jgi:hypothetical protein